MPARQLIRDGERTRQNFDRDCTVPAVSQSSRRPLRLSGQSITFRSSSMPLDGGVAHLPPDTPHRLRLFGSGFRSDRDLCGKEWSRRWHSERYVRMDKAPYSSRISLGTLEDQVHSSLTFRSGISRPTLKNAVRDGGIGRQPACQTARSAPGAARQFSNRRFGLSLLFFLPLFARQWSNRFQAFS